MAAALHDKHVAQAQLLTAIPTVEDTQVAFLLLLFCGAPRANYLLRTLPPSRTATYAADHDAAVGQCLAHLINAGEPLLSLARMRAQLPLTHGGLGLRSAFSTRHTAYWASARRPPSPPRPIPWCHQPDPAPPARRSPLPSPQHLGSEPSRAHPPRRWIRRAGLGHPPHIRPTQPPRQGSRRIPTRVATPRKLSSRQQCVRRASF